MNKYLKALLNVKNHTMIVSTKDDEILELKVFKKDTADIELLTDAVEKAIKFDDLLKQMKDLTKLINEEASDDQRENAIKLYSTIVESLAKELDHLKDKNLKN